MDEAGRWLLMLLIVAAIPAYTAAVTPALSGSIVLAPGERGNDSVQGGTVYGRHDRNSTHHTILVRIETEEVASFAVHPSIGSSEVIRHETAGYRVVISAETGDDTWTADAAARIYVDPVTNRSSDAGGPGEGSGATTGTGATAELVVVFAVLALVAASAYVRWR